MKTTCSLSHVAQKFNARMRYRNSDVAKPKVSLGISFVLYREQTLCYLFLAQCALRATPPEPTFGCISGRNDWLANE